MQNQQYLKQMKSVWQYEQSGKEEVRSSLEKQMMKNLLRKFDLNNRQYGGQDQ